MHGRVNAWVRPASQLACQEERTKMSRVRPKKIRRSTQVERRIPPEVRQRAARAGVVRPDWYAGRRYDPDGERGLELGQTPDGVRQETSELLKERQVQRAGERGLIAMAARRLLVRVRRLVRLPR